MILYGMFALSVLGNAALFMELDRERGRRREAERVQRMIRTSRRTEDMNQVTSTITFTNNAAPEWMPEGSNAYSVMLRYQGRSYTFPYYTGPAWSQDPSTADVLETVLSCSGDDEKDFEDWCADYGQDSDSRKAEATFKACQKQAREIRRLLGEDYDTIVYSENPRTFAAG